MSLTRQTIIQSVYFLSAASLFGCGSRAGSGQVNLIVQAINGQAATSLAQASTLHPMGEVASNTNNANVDSILSAAPDEMVVYLQQISGTSGDNSPTVFWTSPTAAGTALTLSNGTVDLSSVGLNSFSITAGDYTGVSLKFARVAQIKGCVQGSWTKTVSSHVGTFEHSHHGTNSYTSEAISPSSHIFCTRSDQSELSAETFSAVTIGDNASYDSLTNSKTDSELVDLDLAMSNDDNLTVAEIRAASVTLDNSLVYSVANGGTAAITLAIDLNRMLRFYANTRADNQPPNPGMKAGTSYFFTTVFPSSVMAFVGDIGSVEGYQLSASQNGGAAVDAWMTLFKDASGAFVSGNVMPDDDDALTILKGGATLASGTLAAAPGANLDLGISLSTITGIVSQSLNGAAACTLVIKSTSQVAPNQTYDLSYQRLL